jgi:WhiB family redox-sensing transcriptional regulator
MITPSILMLSHRTSTSTDSTAASTDWRQRAICAAVEDPDLFFPISSGGPGLLQENAARAVCARCPVAESCLQWALDTRQDHGVWGGTNPDERRALLRRAYRERVARAAA